MVISKYCTLRELVNSILRHTPDDATTLNYSRLQGSYQRQRWPC